MRNQNPRLQSLSKINPSRVISVIEQGIRIEKLNLEANKILGNEMEVMDIKHRIADTRILLLLLRRNLLP
jgi:hypothetical protein